MAEPIYLKLEKKFDQPLKKVWDKIAMDFGNVADYNPALESSHFDSELKEGVGTRRHCNFPKRGYIKEEITEWEDKKSFRLKFIESSAPMGYMESKFTFKEDDGSTLLIQEFWYRMKAPMGWLSGVMKGKMMGTLVAGLNGLEKALRE